VSESAWNEDELGRWEIMCRRSSGGRVVRVALVRGGVDGVVGVVNLGMGDVGVKGKVEELVDVVLISGADISCEVSVYL